MICPFLVHFVSAESSHVILSLHTEMCGYFRFLGAKRAKRVFHFIYKGIWIIKRVLFKVYISHLSE